MTTLRSGVCANARSTKPTTVYGSPASLGLQSGVAQASIQFGLPTDLGPDSVIVSAVLTVRQTGAWSATSRTLTAQRHAAKWAASGYTWNNRPATTAGTGIASAASSAAGAAGTPWTFDVSADVQAFAAGGTRNYGWRITSSVASALHYIGGFNHATQKPTLDLVYVNAPATPTDLHPRAAVSSGKPTLRWSADPDIASFQVQIDPAGNPATAFSSGQVTTSLPEYSLAASAYAGLAANASTQWRVMVRDTTGRDSLWSEWVTWSYVVKPTLTITQPPASIADPTPPVAWTMTGQTAFQVLVTRNDTGAQVHDSTKQPGTSGNYTPAVDVFTVDGLAYTTEVRAWDSVLRDGMAGDPAYVSATKVSTFALSSSVAGADSLTIDQADPGPFPRLTFTRAAAPDGWRIYRDGKSIFTASDATTLLTGGITYRWTDYGAAPTRRHSYRAAPVVNDVVSGLGSTVQYDLRTSGVWLVDPDVGLSSAVVLWGEEDGDWGYGEDVEVYEPIGATAPVQVTSAMRGIEGQWSGVVVEKIGLASAYTVDTVEARLFAIKAQPAHTFRLSAGDVNIPVVLSGLDLKPTSMSVLGDRVINVSFSFLQNGELPYVPVL